MTEQERQAALNRLEELGETAMVFELGGSDIIRAALSAPAVPVIPGLDEEIALVQRHQDWRRGAEIEMENPKELGISIDKLIESARAYAALPKMQKVDLDEHKVDCSDTYTRGRNSMIESIKFIYGELYAEVK